MNLTGGTSFSGELRYEPENYFPDAHYQKAIEQQREEESLLPDGGTQYYWSGEQGILYHSETGEDTVDPFFPSIEQAERYLENQAELHGQEQYENLVLRKSGNRKVMEATEVLTSQAGLDQW